MTIYRMSDTDVRLFIAATDSDLPMYLGAYAELSTDAGLELIRQVGDDWVHDDKTVAELLKKGSTLVFETDEHAFDDVHASTVPNLRHLLEQIAIARRIATNAHAQQKDKVGVDYIHHPRRVAARMAHLRERAVAWLHDVVEDTAVTEDDLRDQGIDEDVVEAVLLLSRNRGDADDYYPRIAAQPLARSVKLADIANNTDPARTALLDPETRDRLAEKYRKARRTLGVEEEQE
jgi:hypothetical protein